MPVGSSFRGGVLGGVGVAIPDSGLLHARYDATELSLSDTDSVSTWADETGNGHNLAAGDAPTYRTGIINGNPVVRFNGTSNYLEVSYTSKSSQPVYIFFVGTLRNFDSGSAQNFYDGGSMDEMEFRNDTGSWNMYAGSQLSGSTPDQTTHLFGNIFDGANSELRIDGSTDTSGDAGSQSSTGLLMGAWNDSPIARFGPIDVGEFLIYDSQPTVSEVESYLADKWGITI